MISPLLKANHCRDKINTILINIQSFDKSEKKNVILKLEKVSYNLILVLVNFYIFSVKKNDKKNSMAVI